MYQYIKKNYPLLVILVAAAIIRLVFFADMVRGDDLRYAYAAFELSEGYFNLGGWVGNARPGLYVPVALLYWLFEPNSITTLAFPYFASLLSVILVYGIARLHAGTTAGSIAALIWAFLPLDIFLATDLLSDGPLATFSTGSVFCLLVAERETRTRNKYLWYGLSFVAIGWAFFIKPLAAITLVYLVFHLMWNLWKQHKEQIVATIQRIPRQGLCAVVGLVIAVLLVGITVYAQMQPQPLVVSLHLTYKDLIQQFINGTTDVDYVNLRFTQVDLLLPLGILFLVANTFFLATRSTSAKQPLAWFLIVFLYYEWGSVFPNPLVYRPIEEIYEARNLLFLLAPMLIVVSIYLAQGVSKNFGRWVLPLIAILITGFAWSFQDAIEQGKLDQLFFLALLVSLIAPIISLNWVRAVASKTSSCVVLLLLATLAIAMLKPASPYHASFYQSRHARFDLVRAQMPFLESLPTKPIFTNEPFFLDYSSGFQLGFDWAQSYYVDETPDRIAFLPAELTIVNDGTIVYLGELQDMPANWELLRRADSDEGEISLFIYQVTANE